MNLKVIINKQDFNWIKYLIIFISFILPLIITLKQRLRFILDNKKIKELYLENIYENRLYILSTIIILTCYFSFSNYIYREIFFLGLIPWILKQKKITTEEKFYNFYFYAICTKFFITSILVYFSRNEIFPQYKPLFTLLKHCLDLYLITILLIIFISSFKSILGHYLKIMFHKKSDI